MIRGLGTALLATLVLSVGCSAHSEREARVRDEMRTVGLEWVLTETYLPPQHLLKSRKPD